MHRPWLFRTAIVAISTVAAVAFLEVAGARLIGAERLSYYEDVDHRPKPNSAPDINADGLRSPYERADLASDGRNIVFLGDSFVYGWNLTTAQSLPARFEALVNARHPDTPTRVVNFGWPSASPLLAYRRLVEVGAAYRPDVVLMAIDMTDFHDDLKYRALIEGRRLNALMPWTPISVLLTRKVISLVPPLVGLHDLLFDFPADRFFVVNQPLEASRDRLDAISGNIEAIARFSERELDARFVLLVLPRSFQHDVREAPRSWERGEYDALGPYALEPFRFFDEFGRRVDFGVYPLLPDFESSDVFPKYFEDDPHWNEAGTRLAAEAAYRSCLMDGCFERTGPKVETLEREAPAR